MWRWSAAAIAVVSVFLFAQSASASGELREARATTQAAFSWAGYYGGATIGGKRVDTAWTTTSVVVPGVPFKLDASSPRDYDSSSGRFGGFVGYNWQITPRWLVGVEFDFASANTSATTAGVPGCIISCLAGFTGPVATQSSVKMAWDASARARFGFLVSPGLLIYGTGGIAWQKVETSATCQHAVSDPICVAVTGTPFTTATNKTIRTGWTIGVGVEARIIGNWLLRGEYRYADFGTWNNAFDLSTSGVGAFTTNVDTRLKISTQIATLGIAYKF